MESTFYMVAGPNGAGKTVFTKVYFQGTIIRPDDLVKEGHYQVTDSFDLQALVDRKMTEALQKGDSFAFEHNLHTATALSRVEMAKKSDFQTMLVYLAVESVEVCIERVNARFDMLRRAESGEKVDMLFSGHRVGEEEIRRRYRDSLSTLKTNMKAFDQGVVLDNSNLGQKPQPILTFVQGVMRREKGIPAWAEKEFQTQLMLSDKLQSKGISLPKPSQNWGNDFGMGM
jgi:predicted ABC-type ATPase